MKTQANDSQQGSSQAMANNLIQQVPDESDSLLEKKESVPFGTGVQTQLQSAADNSPQVKQLRSVQAMADQWANTSQQLKSVPATKEFQSPESPQNKPAHLSSNKKVAQLTPTTWAANPAITNALALPHGWFSTWKKIKKNIGEYSLLPVLGVPARRAKLNTITGLITEWRADNKHQPDTTTEVRVQNIIAQMPALNTVISVEYEEMNQGARTPAELVDRAGSQAVNALGGHSLDRHGPDLTDAQLQDRLRTGLDRTGAAAPGQTSSRFSSYALYLQTHQAAAVLADAAKGNTLATLNGSLTTYATEWSNFMGMSPGAAKGAFMGTNVTPARLAVTTAANAIANPSPNHLRVNIMPAVPGGAQVAANAARNAALAGGALVPAAEALGAAAALAILNPVMQNMIHSKDRYAITINHGVNVGPSFTGDTALGGGGFARTQPGPMQQLTTTVLTSPGGALPALAPAAGWALVTHFPCSDPPGIV